MTNNSLPQATTQCAVFKGTYRDVFIDRREYDGDEERGVITNKEVQNLLHVKDSRALKILRELVETGVLRKEGKLRGSYYKLK